MLLGGVLIVAPGTASLVPSALVGPLVLLAGGMAFVFAVVNAISEPESISFTDAVPRPEERPDYPRPGSDFAEQFAAVSWRNRRGGDLDVRRDVRAALRSIAIAVLGERNDVNDNPERLLETGAWTDDEEAAAIFTESLVPEVSFRDRLTGLLSEAIPFRRRIRRAVSELALAVVHSDSSPDLTFSGRGDEGGAYWPPIAETATPTGRLQFLVVGSFLAGGIGFVVRRPALFLVTLFGVVAVGYAAFIEPPRPGGLRISRQIEDETPETGDAVRVQVTIRNDANHLYPDLRILDGVPPGLEVIDGTARFSTALRPGMRATFSYTVVAAPGEHVFASPLICSRDYLGVNETRDHSADVGGDGRVTCVPPLDADPISGELASPTLRPGGRADTVSGGGVEFDSVREFRRGDPPSRIDWHRVAKTGDVATIEFRESRTTHVVVVIDDRNPAYVRTDNGTPVIRRSLDVARGLLAGALDEARPVGLAALSDSSCFLRPGRGRAHRRRVRDLLATHPAVDWEPPECGVDVRQSARALAERLPRDVGIYFVTPLTDDGAMAVARHLRDRGRDVVVVSPALGNARGLAETYASLDRRRRVAELRSSGVRVIDLSENDSFETGEPGATKAVVARE